MRRTKEDAEQTRRDLLKQALRVFSRKGFEATRLDDVAQAAGVTRGAIYHHFGGKEELFFALLDDASDQGNRAIQQAVKEGGTFIEIISRIMIYTFSLLEDDSYFRQVTTLAHASTNLKEFKRRRYDEAVELVQSISPAFRAGIEQGELQADLDPETAARAMIAYQNGLAMLWFANQDAFSIKEKADELARIYLFGIVKG